MNWFQIIKLSQMWRTREVEYDFLGSLKLLYELEYKHSMLKKLPFKGHPKRKENIIQQLEKSIFRLINIVKTPILASFQYWLKSHALTDPELWAKEKTENPLGYMGDSWSWDAITNDIPQFRLKEIIYSFIQLNQIYNTEYNIKDEFLDKIFWSLLEKSKNIPVMKVIQKTLNNNYQQLYLLDLQNEELQEFNSITNNNFQSEEEAVKWINNTDFTDDVISECKTWYTGIKDFSVDLEKNGLLEDFIQQVNQYIVFPLWSNMWKGKGMDKTSDRIAQVYLLISNANTINENLISINTAIQVVHQSGSMTQYVSAYIKETTDKYISPSKIFKVMEDISQNTDIDEWNKDLQQIGVEI